MTIRSLDLLDLPFIHRFRNNAMTLDGTRALTRGNPLGAAGFFAYFNPARHIYSAIVNTEEFTLLGGIIHSRGDTFAKLLYLAPVENLDRPELADLLENLVAESGSWGALHVIAEVDETSGAFPALRQAGFSVYAWQRMWEVSALPANQDPGNEWFRANPANWHAIQSLYHQIVPQLMHPVEPLSKNPRGLICNGEAKCYASLATGVQGIVLTPLIHPDTTDVESKLKSLLAYLPERRNRPVYLCVRSYQAWVEPVLEDLGAKAASRQAVMVKHLARIIKNEQTVPGRASGVSVQPSGMSRVELEDKK